MKSLYAQYVYEREGKSCLENEAGFVTYCYLPKVNAGYIEDMYIVPEKRSSGLGRKFVEQVAVEMRKLGATKLITSVSPIAQGRTISTKAILACGFELDSMDANLIYFAINI
jgi:GNAT superfamily N-acetyltransferase